MRLMKPLTLMLSAALLSITATSSFADTAPDFADIVADVSPSVVNISSTIKTKRSQASGNEDIQELLRRFYGLEVQPTQPRVQQSFGSGFIISNDGYVLTNNHVIDGADKVVVRLSDRREIEAKVIGTDPRTDIALIKIAAKDLPIVRIGNPADLRVGDWVLAIGSPFGFDYSATSGIVSAKARALPSEAYVPFIQTDVAINPGNSGGPLFNSKGEVVGINSQIYSRSGGFMGLSFSIPMDVAMEVVQQLRDNGKVSRGWLGVAIQEVTKDLADAYGLPRPAGALIASVEPKSPADKAGLKGGDIVTQFNGKDINMSAELPQAIGRAAVGQSYAMMVFRERTAQTVNITIEALPEEDVAAASPDRPDLSRLGMRLRDLQPAEKQQLKVTGGALIVQVVEGSGAEAGLRPGDVITQVGSTAISNAREFVAAVRKLTTGSTVALRVTRQGNTQIVALKIEAADAGK
ncbi:MAG: DegQ family serine endoprotease [Paraperlucidibaca sp.]